MAVRRSSRRWLKEIAQKGAMKAILLREPGKFEQVQIAETVRPGSGDALVRVHRVGICGTDISGYPDPLLHRREITIYASRNALPADFSRIIQLIEEDRIDTCPWITHRASFRPD